MKHKSSVLVLLCFGVIMFLPACSSNIPPDIREPVKGAPGVAQVRANSDAYLSQRLRWGGVILATENRANSSRLTIVAFPLDDKGRPKIDSASPGRFIAVVDQFLEPLVYSQEREITVTGELTTTEIAKIGEYDYEYPLLAVDEFYLWPLRPETDDYDPPYYRSYYRPYYNPYYPFYPWPHHLPHKH